jgi:hypothetical protein
LLDSDRKTAAEDVAAPPAAPTAVGPLLGVQQPTVVGRVTVLPPPPVVQPAALLASITQKSTSATPSVKSIPGPTGPPLAASMTWEEIEAELEEDMDCDERVDKTAGIGFNPINYQCIAEDEHYKRQLVITLLLPNGIRNLEVHRNVDGKKLIIRGSAPKIFSDVNQMVDANMVDNPFQMKAMEDALMTLRRPKSRSVRIYGEVDLLEQTDPLESEDYVARIDPFSHATVMIVRLKCIKPHAPRDLPPRGALERRPVFFALGQPVPEQVVMYPFVHPYVERILRWVGVTTHNDLKALLRQEPGVLSKIQPNLEGVMPLHVAACGGSLELVRALHVADPPATAQSTLDNIPPFLYAVLFNPDLAVMEYLIDADPSTFRRVFLEQRVDIIGAAVYENPNPSGLGRTYAALERYNLASHQCARNGCNKIWQTRLKRCAKCRRTFYCDRRCQMIDFESHRLKCDELLLCGLMRDSA